MEAVFIYAVGDLLRMGIGLITSPFTTRLLTPEQYGAISLIAAIFTVLNLIHFLGMDSAYPFFRIRTKQKEEVSTLTVTSTVIATVGIIVTTIAYGIVAIISPWVANFTGILDKYTLALTTGTLFTSALVYWYLYIIRYEQQPWAYVWISFLGYVLGAVLFIPLAYLWPQEARLKLKYGILFGVGIISVVYGLQKFSSLRGFPYNPSGFSYMLGGRLLSYGLVLVPTCVLYGMVAVVDRYLLGWLSTSREVGIYTLALQLAGFFGMFKGWFNLAWGPYIIQLVQREKRDVYEAKINQIFNIWTMLLFGLVTLISFWAKEFIRLVYPVEFWGTEISLYLLLFATAFSALWLVVNTSAIISGQKRYHAPIYCIGLILNIILGYILIPKIGAVGAAVGTLVAEIIILFCWLLVTNYFTNVLRLQIRWAVIMIAVSVGLTIFHVKWEIPLVERLGLSFILLMGIIWKTSQVFFKRLKIKIFSRE